MEPGILTITKKEENTKEELVTNPKRIGNKIKVVNREDLKA